MANYEMNFNGIDKLVIYGNGEKLMEKERDFRKIGRHENNKVSSSYGDEIISFFLSSEPKNARKENLFRTDNYYLKYDCSYWCEKKTALYVHVSEISFENLGEFVEMEHNGEKDFLYTYKVTFKHGFTARMLRCEKLNLPGDWTIPEDEKKNGAHWKRFLGDYNNSYEVLSDDEIEKRSRFSAKLGKAPEKYNTIHWYFENVTMFENYYTSETFHKIEKNDTRLEYERIAAVANSVLGSHTHISHYDVERLVKVLNISVKEPKTEKKNILSEVVSVVAGAVPSGDAVQNPEVVTNA